MNKLILMVYGNNNDFEIFLESLEKPYVVDFLRESIQTNEVKYVSSVVNNNLPFLETRDEIKFTIFLEKLKSFVKNDCDLLIIENPNYDIQTAIYKTIDSLDGVDYDNDIEIVNIDLVNLKINNEFLHGAWGYYIPNREAIRKYSFKIISRIFKSKIIKTVIV